MAIQDVIQELQEFDFNDIDFDNIGTWPTPVKAIVWILVFVAVLVLGYIYVVKDQQITLDKEQQQEITLKKEFEKKAYQAANLEAYRKQMVEMEESFGALLSQLPSDTEVPGLLEDITNKGVESGLEIETINLGEEKSEEFYIELPMEILVSGGYHDLGAFVSGIAGLPRIVTLHNFSIDVEESSSLKMKISAKTYRYKDLEG